MARVRDLMATGQQGTAAQSIAGTYGAITAAGTTQGAATLLSYETNLLTTGAGADSVVLPTGAQGSQPGDSCFVLNGSATTAQVFPGGSDTINGSTSAVNVAQNKQAVLKRYSATAWGLMVTA